MGGFTPWYDPEEYWGNAEESLAQGADWLFNSPVLKPISDWFGEDESRKKAARALVPGYSGLEAVSGGIAGLGALAGMGIDNDISQVPDARDILEREARGGIHSAMETVAPIDVATAGLSGLSGIKGLKSLGGAARALEGAEGLYGGGQVAHGLGTGNLPEAGVGALRVAGGSAGYLSPHLGRELNFDTTGSVVGNELPNFVSAMGEGRGFIPDEIGIGESLRRPREPFSTLAEHGTPTSSWLDRGETPKLSPEGAYGAGLYASSVTGEAPGYARVRSTAMREHPDLFTEEVRGEMVPLEGDPRVIKADVSADKPLFLGDEAPRDLRMQALIELQRARRSGVLDPEYADQLKNAILRPEATGHDLVDIGKELLLGNITPEARGSYSGDPYSEFIKSRDYDLWGPGKRGEPQRELVIPDPRRQFKAGEVYDPRGGNREVFADSSGESIPISPTENASQWQKTINDRIDLENERGRKLNERMSSPRELTPSQQARFDEIEANYAKEQSLANPSLRVSEAPPIDPSQSPIQIGDWLEETAKELGYTPFNLGSRMVEGGGGPSKPVLSTNADALKTILKSGKVTKFTPKTIVDTFNKAGIEVPPELVARIPEFLSELEASGWVNKKATGTYTLNSTPTRTGPPVSPMGKEMDLGAQLESTKKMLDEGQSLSDIEKIKSDILSKPVSKIRGEESIPLQTPVGVQEGSGITPPRKPLPPPTKPPGKPPKRPEGYREQPSNKSFIDDLTDLPKTLKSAIDISFPLRQGLFLLNRPEGRTAMRKGLKSVKESSHLATRADLETRANKELYKKHGLNQIEYDPTTPTSESEQFPSKIAEKIPLVKQSQRVYNDQSNLMRADLFDKVVKDWSKKGLTPETSPKLYDGLSKYLNVLTGRDPLPTKLAQAGHLLNKAFWSPQFVKSRLQILNPKFYWDLPKEVQKMAIRDIGGTIGVLGGILGGVSAVAKAHGVKDVSVEGDLRHTDFGKLRVGKQTYDFFSGLLPIVRAASRITTGTMKTRKGEYNLPGGPGLGRDKKLKDAPFGRTSGSEFAGFVEGKTSPIYQIGKGLLTGEGFAGEPYGGPQFLEDIAGPMGIFDILEAGGFDPESMKDIPSEFKELDPLEMSKGLPSLLGVGVQTDFERKKKSKKPKKSKELIMNW